MTPQPLQEFTAQRSIALAMITEECEVCCERTQSHIVQVCDGISAELLTTGLVCAWCIGKVAREAATHGDTFTCIPLGDDAREWVRKQMRP